MTKQFYDFVKSEADSIVDIAFGNADVLRCVEFEHNKVLLQDEDYDLAMAIAIGNLWDKKEMLQEGDNVPTLFNFPSVAAKMYAEVLSALANNRKKLVDNASNKGVQNETPTNDF